MNVCRNLSFDISNRENGPFGVREETATATTNKRAHHLAHHVLQRLGEWGGLVGYQSMHQDEPEENRSKMANILPVAFYFLISDQRGQNDHIIGLLIVVVE